MKALNTIVKILTALAAVAGVIYIVATYGEQIVAWARKMLSSLPQCPGCQSQDADQPAPAAEMAVAEPDAAQEAVAEAAEEVAAPEAEAPAAVTTGPVAEASDFAE